jgi:hypothetical protein
MGAVCSLLFESKLAAQGQPCSSASTVCTHSASNRRSLSHLSTCFRYRSTGMPPLAWSEHSQTTPDPTRPSTAPGAQRQIRSATLPIQRPTSAAARTARATLGDALAERSDGGTIDAEPKASAVPPAGLEAAGSPPHVRSPNHEWLYRERHCAVPTIPHQCRGDCPLSVGLSVLPVGRMIGTAASGAGGGRGRRCAGVRCGRFRRGEWRCSLSYVYSAKAEQCSQCLGCTASRDTYY